MLSADRPLNDFSFYMHKLCTVWPDDGPRVGSKLVAV